MMNETLTPETSDAGIASRRIGSFAGKHHTDEWKRRRRERQASGQWGIRSKHLPSEEERKEKWRVYGRTYRALHAAKVREIKRAWDHAHPEKIAEMGRRYREKHAEKKLRYRREYYRKNRAFLLEKGHQYRLAHGAEIRIRRRAHHLLVRETHKITSRRRKFGPAAEAYYAAKLEEQQGKCAICRRSQNKPNADLALDHNHDFSQTDPNGFRGLLCSGCNYVLGHCREDFGLLGTSAFADYILRYMVF